MKKTYFKPTVGFESFQLSAALATACSTPSAASSHSIQTTIAINHGANDCTFANGQFYNFFNCSIDLTGPEFDGNDTLCYHGPMLSSGIVFTFS